jgi:hypothetical protein
LSPTSFGEPIPYRSFRQVLSKLCRAIKAASRAPGKLLSRSTSLCVPLYVLQVVIGTKNTRLTETSDGTTHSTNRRCSRRDFDYVAQQAMGFSRVDRFEQLFCNDSPNQDPENFGPPKGTPDKKCRFNSADFLKLGLSPAFVS